MVRSRPGAGDAGFADGHGFGWKGGRLEMVIKPLVLAKDDRVVNGHRLQQHAVSVLDGRRRHDDQARIMRVERLHALAVKRPRPGRAARRQPNGDRAGHLRAPIERGRLVDDLIEARRGEIGELHLNDRPHPADGRPDGRAHNGILADRRVQHAAGKLLGQILGRLECAAESAHILSVNEDPRVLGQCSGLRFPNGFKVGDAHACVDRAGCSNTSLRCPEAKAHQFSL